MTLFEIFEHEGFVHHLQDEPHEDYWLLEGGAGPDLLVEDEGEGWCISRMPRDDEPRGMWVELSSKLDEETCAAEVRSILDAG